MNSIQPAQSLSATPKRIAANRKNSQKSTGPKSVRGKLIAGRNSMRHGLYSDLILPSENREDFDKHLAGLFESYSPVGPLEEILVQRIAISMWRYIRGLRWEAQQAKLASFTSMAQKVNENCGFELHDLDLDPRTAIANVQGYIEILRQFCQELKTIGHLSLSSQENLFCTLPKKLATKILMLHHGISMAERYFPGDGDVETGGYRLPNVSQPLTLVQTLENDIAHLERTKLGLAAMLQDNCSPSITNDLPELSALEVIVKYLSSNNRDFYTAVEFLEELQLTRRGVAQKTA